MLLLTYIFLTSAMSIKLAIAKQSYYYSKLFTLFAVFLLFPLPLNSCCLNCQSCQTGSGTCLSCWPGFVLVTNTCPVCISPCAECSPNPNFCTACISHRNAISEIVNDYYLAGGQCFQCSAYCLHCLNTTACQTCETNYGLNAANSQCQNCPLNC